MQVKFKSLLKPVNIFLCIAGFISMPIFADTATSTNPDSANDPSQTQAVTKYYPNKHAKSKHVHKHYHGVSKKKHIKHKKAAAVATDTTAQPSVISTQSRIAAVNDLEQLYKSGQEYLPFDIDVPGQSFVTTGPYVGVPIQFAGSNLIINSPSVNTDEQLLTIRKKILKQFSLLSTHGIVKEPYHSHLLLSGVVEGHADYTSHGNSAPTSDIDVTNVGIDLIYLGPSDWTLGYIELLYDNGLPANNFYRVSNSRLYVNKAFITIGDFCRSPVYGTVGQFYVPFGVYSSSMISDPLTKLLTRTKERSILIGFHNQDKNALYGAAYVFRGDSHVGSLSRINNGGVNLGYVYNFGFSSGDIGGGLIGNIADSTGMQEGTEFQNDERLHHKVPGYNLRFSGSIGEHFDALAEWVSATKRFNVNDMSFNDAGARPWALNTEADYSFSVCSLPSSIGVSYGQSHQALALGIPEARYSVVFNTSIWRNTLQSLEYRHDRNYAKTNTANGPVNSDTSPGTCTATSCRGIGKADNAITAQFDYYF